VAEGSLAFVEPGSETFAWARTLANAPQANRARTTPPMKTNRPVKTRRLKKADSDVYFFFTDEVCAFLQKSQKVRILFAGNWYLINAANV
jgi:hypothetical protein